MARERLPRTSPCPCGSGKKYKHCCHNKGFEWVADDDGTVYQSTPLSPEAVEILQQQKERFVAKFGREPGPDEPLFFDAPPVEQVEFQMDQAMKAAGLDPAIIHAYEKTDGLLVTESNQHLIPEKDLAAWQAAIDSYEARHRGKPEQP